MNPKVSYALATWPLAKIAGVMFEKGFSQLPVLDQNKIVGQVDEKIISNWLTTADAIIELGQTTIRDLHLKLDPEPPRVETYSALPELIKLLRTRQLIPVYENDSAIGTITKADLLKTLIRLRSWKLWS